MIFKELLSGIEGGRILDVGCGNGQFTGMLVHSLASFESVTGVDVDRDALRQAGERFGTGQYTFLLAGAGDLPFPDESFDMVVISRALHHVEDPEKTLGEMRRVLSTGGTLLINEMIREVMTESQESQLLYHHLRSEIDNALGISHNHTFMREELIRLGSFLRLHTMHIHEYIPETDFSNHEEAVHEFSARLDTWHKELDGHPRQAEFMNRIEKLKERIREHGISRPPHMVIIGRK